MANKIVKGDVVIHTVDNMHDGDMLFYVEDVLKDRIELRLVSAVNSWVLAYPPNELEVVGHVEGELKINKKDGSFMPEEMRKFKAAVAAAKRRGVTIRF